MSRVVSVVACGLAMLGLLTACGADGDGGAPSIVVADAVVPAPAGANGALYLDLTNEGDGDDELVAVHTDAAGAAEVHRTEAGDDGLMRMVAVDGLEIPAGETVRFEPGGLHVMLLDVDPVEEGDVITVELEFDRSGTIVVDAEVGDVGAGASE